MQTHVVFRNLSDTVALEDDIRSRAADLETFYKGIVSCRVMVDIPHEHRLHGRTIHVRVELSLPGEDIVVSHEDEQKGASKATAPAVHAAFDKARRRLEDVARRQRGDVKSHRVEK